MVCELPVQIVKEVALKLKVGAGATLTVTVAGVRLIHDKLLVPITL